ncbi:hypothetical protein J8281_10735 [Aquimarina sp. U1-2]|uniref:hypothetical protein n=1 Tax=Aquimarina sp. U1-2 TaxID=2823141 RepID=UPI001AECDE36|nr:hypothetical protein [Aquimarina sp. U1-2]MBP2832661.1 hypothetical protein [Aquimarina sp. U1-2]
MDKKEEEILSMHYQIEKTDIKQQKMEDRLLSISKDLRKSKKISNLYFILIVGLIILMAASSFYFIKNDTSFSSENADEIEKLRVINDSLQHELLKLRTAVSKQSYSSHKLQDTLKNDRESKLDAISKDSSSTSNFDFKRQFSYVKRAYKSNDALFIEADFIEYYEGRKAVKKAKEYGEAEYDIDKKGDTLYYLFNNYYIHNQNSTTRILELDDKARVRIESINQISNGFPLKAFQKIIKSNPVLILEISNGVVYKISQQKLL